MRVMVKCCKIGRMTDRLGLATLLLCLMSWPAQAGRDIDQDEALRLVERGELKPLQGILADALKRYPGRPLEVELELEHGDYIYEIELVTHGGQVMELEYDARTGQILDIDEED